MKKHIKLIYTMLIVFMNESLLAIYNSVLNTDAFLSDSLEAAFSEIIPAYVFGFIFEYFIVSHIVERIIEFIETNTKLKKGEKYFDETIMALGCVLVVTFYGLTLHHGFSSFSLTSYLNEFILNAIFMVPVFIFIVDPIAIKVIEKYYYSHIQ